MVKRSLSLRVCRGEKKQNSLNARDQASGGFAVVQVFRVEGIAQGNLFNVKAKRQSRSESNHDECKCQPITGTHADRQKNGEHPQVGRLAHEAV